MKNCPENCAEEPAAASETTMAVVVSAWAHKDHVVRVTPPVPSVVDTAGAGDIFQAALLEKLSEEGTGNPMDAG